ncbi:MAG: hypothetical protein ACTSVY_16640 [Candidatus Helarchaeota archaeon]
MSVISDFLIKEFKSEKSINVLRIITSILFVLTIIFSTWLLTPNAWDATALPTLFSNIFILIGQSFTNFFRLSYMGWEVLIESIYSAWGLNYNLPDASALIPIGVPADTFFNAFYFGLFQICIVGSILACIYFIFNCNSRWAFISFILLQLPMILAILTPSLGEIFSYIPAWEWLEIISYILIIPMIVCLGYTIKYLTKKSSKWIVTLFLFIIFLVFFNSFKEGTNFAAIGASLMAETHLINPFVIQSLLGNPLAFFSSPILWIAFLNILFLETSFQTAYMYEVLLPTSEREKRIKLQMEELERLARLKQEELEKEKKELQEESEVQSISIRRFFSSAAFDYMREMIEKRKDIEKKEEKKKKEKKKKESEQEKEEEEEILELDKVNQLFMYIETRYAQDKQAKESLTAKAASPEMKNLLFAAVKGTIIRSILLIFLTLIIVNTAPILIAISQPDIQYSFEILTREIIIIILLPICLLFPSIGSIIKILKRPKIYRERKKEDEKLKEELEEEEEYKKILEEEEKKKNKGDKKKKKKKK